MNEAASTVVFYSIGVDQPITPAEPLPPLPAIPRSALVVIEGRAPICALRSGISPLARIASRSHCRLRPTPGRSCRRVPPS